MFLKMDRILITLTLALTVSCNNKMNLIKQWKELDFAFPDEITKQQSLTDQTYVPGNSIPIDVDVFHSSNKKTKIFITIPRFDIGRPFTLAKVAISSNSEGRSLIPYPDLAWQNIRGDNCEGLTSVFRVAIDECARLWVLDTGKIGANSVCPAKLLAFDLHTDKLIHKHTFPTAALLPHSLLVTPIVDARDPSGGCQNTFVYIADITGYGMVVYDHANDRSWRVDNKLFYPHPTYGTFDISGETFDLMDGLIGMSLSPMKTQYDDRVLYFHALASVTENFVRTSVLRNSSAWENIPTANPRDFRTFPYTRPSQSAAQAMDRSGNLFFGLLSTTELSCWNYKSDYSNAMRIPNTVSRDPDTLQFPSGLKIVNNAKGEQELWVLTSRFQKVMTGTMTTNEVNFRILAGKVQDLVKGTRCVSPNGIASGQTNLVGVTPSKPIGSSNYGGASSK